ncbi:hypothetical protein H9Q13_02045 [Pontibacter sp. JH31]|uniref:STAS/SEC14 domain-containing protein n=1 Tax=Pontibacter aquaedesilientis TaxID=2766980 RepID=A0ABR7XCA6_9BACT|nr:hypothetical protein [Pontibacter aquaedesilientis]MBD1395933.1 hypothetical protein [Pontibacter aquaedesilientis]
MEIYKSESFMVQHSEEQLLLRCKKSLHSEEFRAGLTKALQYAREHQIKKWLLDLREIGKLSEADETWVQVQLFPQIMIHLGMKNYVAVVMDERCYANMVDESGLLGLKSYNSFIIINTFYQLEEAASWLEGKHPNYV